MVAGGKFPSQAFCLVILLADGDLGFAHRLQATVIINRTPVDWISLCFDYPVLLNVSALVDNQTYLNSRACHLY